MKLTKSRMTALLVAMMAISTAASAQVSVGVEVDHTAKTGKGSTNAVSVIPGVKFGDTTIDAKLTGDRSDGGVNTQAAEIRARQDFKLTSELTAFGRVGVGSFLQTGKNTSFYDVEAGVGYAVLPKLTLNTSYKFQNGLQDRQGVKTNTLYVGADYALTPKDVVGVKVFRVNGNTVGNGIQGTYTKTF